MTSNDNNPLKIREIILNTQKPVVFKNFPLNWLCFQGGLELWCKELDEFSGSETSFERISKYDSREPQWERKRQAIQMTAKEFLTEYSKDNRYWCGLNYKRRHELPAECTNGIDFSVFGFPHAADDATLWLSSQGANTPCHYDSYGCNIVVQVFGKKSWLLFPPNAAHITTRIPYEESSIYCKENFYNPGQNIQKYIDKYEGLVHHIILESNDVLIVPKHWWHYVEALDISLSVNAWIPLKCDLDQQIDECIVKYLTESFVKNCTTEEQKYIMNPNQLSAISTKDELFKILKFLIDKSLKSNTEDKKVEMVYDYNYLSETEVSKILKEFENSVNVPLLCHEEFEKYLKANSQRFCENLSCDGKELSLDGIEDMLINSICSPLIIQAIKNEFYKRYQVEVEVEDIKRVK